MKTTKKITMFDKIMFPLLNTVMLAAVFAFAQDLLSPTTKLEWVAVILITSFFAMPIAKMNRKEMIEMINSEHAENERKAQLRKGA